MPSVFLSGRQVIPAGAGQVDLCLEQAWLGNSGAAGLHPASLLTADGHLMGNIPMATADTAPAHH